MTQPLDYSPNPAGLDFGTYDLHEGNTGYRFRDDMTLRQSHYRHLPVLLESPHWEDRVRAVVVRDSMRITLPDGFPCIYERADSPNRQGAVTPSHQPWVTSPDVDMLHLLLPDYQALWDAHTSQWGPERRRIMQVGFLDGLSAHGLHRPGTTPTQVLAKTMATHSDMRKRAPEHIKAAVDEWVSADIARARARRR